MKQQRQEENYKIKYYSAALFIRKEAKFEVLLKNLIK